jgi:hypothetical protein
MIPIMTPSIRNWYANESSRDRGGLAHDWENDEPYERTPDSWLDDLELTRADGLYRRPAPRQRSVASGSLRSSGVPTAPRQPRPVAPRHPDVPSSGDSLDVAVHVLRTLIPGIGTKGLTRLVRGHGWPSATKAAVQAITEELQSGRRPAPVSSDRATLAMVIGVMRSAADVKGGDDVVIGALRRCGWTHVTRAQVAAARAPWHASSPSGPAEAGRVADRSPIHRADVCPSCNTAISVLARCRCS